MALKTLMLRKNLNDRQSALEALLAKDSEFVARESEIEKSIAEVTEEEERTAVEQAIDAYEAEKAEHDGKKDNLRAEIERLEKELAEIEEEPEEEEPAPAEERKENKKMEIRDEQTMQERAAFADYLRTGNLTRSDYNMEKSNNGAIVPKTIAQEVITKIANISPLYDMATKYHVKGQLDVPYYPASSEHVIGAAYGTEFTDLEAASGDFSSTSLTGFLAGALAKISKSLLNNTEIDVIPFVVDEMAKAFAAFIEKEAIVGTANKIVGLCGATLTEITASKKSSITADELIELQGKINDGYQKNACWLMNPATRLAIRKLKDGQNNYLLIPNFQTEGPGWSLLGKPVYVSDNMPAMGTASNKAVFYGDFSGLAMKFSEDIDIEILRERFAPQHAVGVVGWTEVDAKVVDVNKIACIKMGSAD